MLDFFRRYQRILFFFITIVIIVTFVFFGTFQTTPLSVSGNQVAFTAIDGSEISRSELQEMVSFLSTDSQDQIAWGGGWGPNFLNDGVIVKDFLHTGLASMLGKQYLDELKDELKLRLQRERAFVPYQHPDAKFLSAKTIWAYFAPDLKEAYEGLVQEDPKSLENLFDSRIRLFLEEKKFPPKLLSHALRLQEQQYTWIDPDPYLPSKDLSLFSYRTLEDWFGRRFLNLLSQFIINTSILAEKKGYSVSKEEALADLVRNSILSFEKNKEHPTINVTNSQDYYREQLRRLGMDQAGAVCVWRKVLLFRRLFNEIGNSIFMDTFSYQKFYDYAREKVSVELHQLPQSLRFSSYRDLQKFETYLDIVASKKRSELSPLALPRDFLSSEEVEKEYPELVSRRYLIRLSKVDVRALQVKVGLKEAWDWELEEKNWNLLKERYPELSSSNSLTRDERFSMLEKLEPSRRLQIDSDARSAIVAEHPEWLEEAMASAKESVVTIEVRKEGGSLPIEGVVNRENFISLLDKASLPNGQDAVKRLLRLTEDGKFYHRIVILDRDDSKRVLSFSEANKDNVLDKILDSRLEREYQKMKKRGGLSKEFLNAEGLAKPLNEVKNFVADRLFYGIQNAIYEDYQSFVANRKEKVLMTGDFCASRRFYYFVRTIKEMIEKGKEAAESLLRNVGEKAFEERLPPLEKLSEQWKLEREEHLIARRSYDVLESEVAFSMGENSWSKVFFRDNGDIHYFKTKHRVSGEGSVFEKAQDGQKKLANDARRFFMEGLLKKMEEQEALSLSDSSGENED